MLCMYGRIDFPWYSETKIVNIDNKLDRLILPKEWIIFAFYGLLD